MEITNKKEIIECGECKYSLGVCENEESDNYSLYVHEYYSACANFESRDEYNRRSLNV